MRLNYPPLMKSLCYVDGRWTAGADGASVGVTNPANGELIGHVAMLDRAAIAGAVEAAHRAQATWRWTALKTRTAALHRWAALMQAHREDLAQLLTLEQGKPIAEARGEIDYAASFIPWFAEGVRRLNGHTIPSHIDDAQLGTIKEPVGVAALITPWNFPSAMITRKAAAALAVGCTVVVKPAHETPYSALALAQLAEEAGFPPGVFNVVLGEPQMAMETLVAHPMVGAVSFTGSTRVGRLVSQVAAAADVKKLALELGGNAPFIVTADADIAQAVEVAVAAKFQTSGQDCCASNRILVHRSVHDEFAQAFAQAVAALPVGPGQDEAHVIGPLIHEAAVQATLARVQDAVDHGAEVLVGGQAHALGGCFVQPTVVSGLTPAMRMYREETFAPIVGIMAFDDLDEAVALANDTEYGLAAYICARQQDVIWRLMRQLRFAMVAVNGARFTGPPVPFGGMKSSGLGREGGEDGFEPFVETKYFCLSHLGLPA
jgi:aspartate-semialdehyde dehydrogenase